MSSAINQTFFLPNLNFLSTDFIEFLDKRRQRAVGIVQLLQKIKVIRNQQSGKTF